MNGGESSMSVGEYSLITMYKADYYSERVINTYLNDQW